MYSAQVLDHFENPRNTGEVNDASLSVQVENPVCGDVLKLTAKIEHGRITDIRFRAKGCVSAMACASLITQMAKGRFMDEARGIDQEQLLAAIGGLPPASGHAAHLAIDALRALLGNPKSGGQ